MLYAICADGTMIYMGESENDMLREIANFEHSVGDGLKFVYPQELNDFGDTDDVFTVIRGNVVELEKSGWRIME